jgi:hypothetical protein
MLRAAADDSELVTLERAGFGVSHDGLGAALCESWGLAATAVAAVRHHVGLQATLEFSPLLPAGKRSLSALSAVVHTLMVGPERLDDVVDRLAPQAELDPERVRRGALELQERLDESEATTR